MKSKTYIIVNLTEEKIIGLFITGIDFLNFVYIILEENDDINNFTIETEQDAIDYINTYCDNLLLCVHTNS
jgi:hypothetical protein